MIHKSISDARQSLSETIEQTVEEPVALEKHGRVAAVMISPELYESMVDALEELEDLAAVDASLQEAEPNIPWEDVRRDLGIDA